MIKDASAHDTNTVYGLSRQRRCNQLLTPLKVPQARWILDYYGPKYSARTAVITCAPAVSASGSAHSRFS